MDLTEEQRDKISGFCSQFQKYLDSDDREADLEERRERSKLYEKLLSPSAVENITELEFGQVISSLWASQLWGNKSYLVDKLIDDNGLKNLSEQIHELLWGKGSVSKRYDAFRREIKGIGTAMVTELLAFVYPEECGLWNDKARKALGLLGFKDALPFIRKSQISGSEYGRYNELLRMIGEELEQNGIQTIDMLGIDYFLFEVWKAGKAKIIPTDVSPLPLQDTQDFDHDEVIDQLLAIGQWLGFETEREKKVASGARVDVVWQARIANLGVVTYVFEVQRRGSVDSLILNLQRARNNPSVQRLIVVANSDDIAKVKVEITTLPESFRKAVGFMKVQETIRAAELLDELSGIINSLELVRSEFGT